MSAGAAYGAGIYMAADSSTSFGYVRAGMTWKNSSMANDSNYKGQTPYVDPYGDYYDYGGQQDTSASHIACICLGEGTSLSLSPSISLCLLSLFWRSPPLPNFEESPTFSFTFSLLKLLINARSYGVQCVIEGTSTL